MAWRVHLTNQAIQRLDILPGKTVLLAAWTQRDRATYFDLESGAHMGEHQHKAVSRQSDKWAEFVASLVAPNGVPLPFVRTAQMNLYTTGDGKSRLYQTGAELVVEIDGKETALQTGDVPLAALAFDRTQAITAGLDEKGRLHLYRQQERIGTFNLNLKLSDDLPATVCVGGALLFATNGREIVLADASGKSKKRQAFHYLIGRMACSPDGRWLATSDLETGVVRVYDGAELSPTHQRHAIDLLSEATQLQLIADLPSPQAAPGALAIADDGTLAFAMSGVICVTGVKAMDVVPRAPR